MPPLRPLQDVDLLRRGQHARSLRDSDIECVIGGEGGRDGCRNRGSRATARRQQPTTRRDAALAKAGGDGDVDAGVAKLRYARPTPMTPNTPVMLKFLRRRPMLSPEEILSCAACGFALTSPGAQEKQSPQL